MWEAGGIWLCWWTSNFFCAFTLEERGWELNQTWQLLNLSHAGRTPSRYSRQVRQLTLILIPQLESLEVCTPAGTTHGMSFIIDRRGRKWSHALLWVRPVVKSRNTVVHPLRRDTIKLEQVLKGNFSLSKQNTVESLRETRCGIWGWWGVSLHTWMLFLHLICAPLHHMLFPCGDRWAQQTHSVQWGNMMGSRTRQKNRNRTTL